MKPIEKIIDNHIKQLAMIPPTMPRDTLYRNFLQKWVCNYLNYVGELKEVDIYNNTILKMSKVLPNCIYKGTSKKKNSGVDYHLGGLEW